MLKALSLAAFFMSAPANASEAASDSLNAQSAEIDEQLQCVMRDYSADQQREFDAWASAYDFGKTPSTPTNFKVSLARAAQCREDLSWTSSQETMAAFYATFVLEENAANAGMPKARENVGTFFSSLDAKEAKAMESALATIASGLVNAAGDDAKPGFEVLLANYALDKKLTEKLPTISEEEKGQVTHLLFLGTIKDLTWQLFEKESLGDQTAQSDTKTASQPPARSEPPPSSPPRARNPSTRSEQTPTPPSANN